MQEHQLPTGGIILIQTALVPASPLLGILYLGPLGSYGGPTETIPLLVGSPAADAGDDIFCAAPPVNGLDQRGSVRPFGPQCDIGAVEQYFPARNATLVASSPGPHVASGLTFTASATCTGGCEYKWLRKAHGGTSWTTLYDYAANHGNELLGSEVGVGAWDITVQVRNAGSNATSETQGNVTYVIVTNTPASGANITPSTPVVHVPDGLTFTASATCSGTCEYKWAKYNLGTLEWTTLYDYPAAHGAQLSGTDVGVGNWTIRVYIRNAGSAAAYETYKDITYYIVSSTPASGATLVATLPSPQDRRAVNFIAAGIGGSGSYEYRFRAKDLATNEIILLQDFPSTNNVFSVASLPPGTYQLRVIVKNVGSTAAYETYQDVNLYTITGPASGVTLTANPPTSPQEPAVVTFTANGSGGLGSYEYKLEKSSDGGAHWIIVQDYPSTNNVWSGATITPGTYHLRASVRNKNTSGASDAVSDILGPYTLAAPASGGTLAANFPSPHVAAGLTFTANATCPVGCQYKWMIKPTSESSWTTLYDYSADHGNVLLGSEAGVGNWDITVRIKNTGATVDQTQANITFTIVTTTPASGANIALSSPSPHVAADLTFTASATCTGGCEYKWLKYNKTTLVWTTLYDYPAAHGAELSGTDVGVGNWKIRVYIRNAGSIAAFETYKDVDYAIVTDPPATGATITPSFNSPHNVTELTFTVEGVGGNGPGNYEFKFMRYNGTAWTTLQNFPSQNNVFDASSYAPGVYTFRVFVRNFGSVAPYEALTDINYTILP